nr:trafficking protein particle complex subunit 6B-like [Quercus suber]
MVVNTCYDISPLFEYKVLDIQNIKLLPSRYILKQWTKQERVGRVLDSYGCIVKEDPKLDITNRYKDLCCNAVSIASKAAEIEEASMFLAKKMIELNLNLAARRIEAIGFQVGLHLSERYTMERPRFSDHLDAIKFICKDFWSELFKKQIDNLKTNHRGTFVLQDNRFRWLAHISGNPSPKNGDLSQYNYNPLAENKAAQATSMHLNFPCGIIRGACLNCRIPHAVTADISNHPACSFVVCIKA